MRRASGFLGLLLAASLVLASPDARAIGQATGRVTGTVIEGQSQAPIPGAAVTIKGGSGVSKTVQSQEDGTFEIDDIPPGTYDLVLTYEGLKPFKRKVLVSPDTATPVSVVWTAEAAQEETTVVEEERRLTNPDSPQTGQIYSRETTDKLPLARAYSAISAQVAGATTSGGNPSVKGARLNNNRLLVNGLDITDPVTNQATAQFQMDALDSVQLTTGGFEAKYNALGAITSVQTRRGTNEYHGSASFYWAPTQLVDYDTYGPQIYDGSKPFDYSSVRPEQGKYEMNLNAQGPIIKDHLFFNAGIHYDHSASVQPAGPPRFVQAPSNVFSSIFLTAGLTYVPVPEHRIHAEVFADPQNVEYDSNAGSAANSTTPYSETGRFAGGERGTLEWAWQASKHVSTKVMVGGAQSTIETGPQGLRGIDSSDLNDGPYNWYRPNHTNQDDGTSWFNAGSHNVITRRRLQLDASVTATGEAGGHHEAEFGVQGSYLEQRSQLSYPGGTSSPDGITGYGVSYSDKGGGPLNTGLCDLDPSVNPGALSGNYTGTGCFKRTYNRSFAGHADGHTLGVYLQDRWKPRKWLTILPGLRYDTGTVAASDSTVAQTAGGFGPRFSVIADVTNDQKTIVQVTYGRMTEMPSLSGVVSYDQARRAVGVVEQYNATDRRFEFASTTGGLQGTQLSFGRTPASADEILISGRRELTKAMMVRVDYTYRYLRDQFEAQEVNAIMDPTGTRTVGFVNGIPQRITLYGFNPASTARYNGVDLILEGKTQDLDLQASYTLSESLGDQGSGAFDNPRFAPFYQSFQSGIDTRHQIKTSTTYQLFPGFIVGLILNWRSGVALIESYSGNESGYTIRRAPTGYEPGAYYNTGTANPNQNGTFSDIRSWTEFRSPDLFTTNLMLSYDFFALLKQHFTLNCQISNVLGLNTATGVSTSGGAPNTNQFGLANTRNGFRSIQVGARYEF